MIGTARRLAAALGLALALAPAAAQTPEAGRPVAPPVRADPEATTANFGDWTMRCRRLVAGQPTRRICEVAQSIQTPGAQGPIAQIAIGRVGPADPLRVTVVLPPNVSFPSAPRVATDEKDPQPVELPWRRCVPGGCFADAAIDEATLRRWRALSGRGSITFLDSSGHAIPVPMSFRGLDAALDALAKS
jgi:invasion protein IalB